MGIEYKISVGIQLKLILKLKVQQTRLVAVPKVVTVVCQK